MNRIKEEIEELEHKWSQLEKEELTIDGSDWQRLAALREERRSLEDRILSLYLDKEKLEAEPPDES